MKVVVGLGNPGDAYLRTPHNVGFRVVDRLAERLSAPWRRSLRFHALTAQASSEFGRVLLVKPQTFMNLSGQAVAAVLGYHKVPVTDLVVVSDDADLEPGRLRVRARGRSGGHRGLDSIVESLGTDGFARVRVGIGRGSGRGGLARHVLGAVDEEEERVLAAAAEAAADAVLCIAGGGVDAAMNRFNGRKDGVPGDGDGGHPDGSRLSDAHGG